MSLPDGRPARSLWWTFQDETGTATSGSGATRSKVLTSGIVTSLLPKAIAGIGPLVLVHLTLDYLGKDIYGVWMTAAALVGMAMWADLGLGNGLMTKLTQCHARSDIATARQQVSTTYAILICICAAFLAVLAALAQTLPWAAVLNIADPETAGLGTTIAVICVGAFALNMPLSLIHRVQWASQRVTVSNLWQAAGNLLSVALAWLAVHADAGPAVVVAGAVAGPVVMNAINTSYVFLRPARNIAPRFGDVDPAIARSIFQLGGGFFVISVLASLSLGADSVIVAHTAGLAAVTDFSVVARLFTILALLITVINAPFWPAVGDALARQDVEWVRRTTLRMTALSATVVLVVSAAMIIFATPLLQVWVDDSVAPDTALFVAFGVWWLLLATASPRFMVANAAGHLRPQIIGWTVFGVVAIATKWFAALVFGLPAMVAAGAICYLLVLWPTAQQGYRQVLRRKPHPMGGIPVPVLDAEGR